MTIAREEKRPYFLLAGTQGWRKQEANGRALHGQDVQLDVGQPEEAHRRSPVS